MMWISISEGCHSPERARAITDRRIAKGITEPSECLDICSHYSSPAENALHFPVRPIQMRFKHFAGGQAIFGGSTKRGLGATDLFA
jgi:hypothetical protein